jgi:sugar phosphate isomerase/epimerase
VLEPIRRSGFDRVEVSSALPHFPYRDRRLAARAAAALRALDLKAHSLHAPFSAEIDIASADPRRRAASIETLREAAEAAAALGAGVVVMHPGPDVKSPAASDDLAARARAAAESIARLADACHPLDVRLAVENVLPHLMFGRLPDLVGVMGAVDRDDVGFCLDAGHANLAGAIDGYLRALADRVRVVHAHDNRGAYDDHLPPGQGSIDWRALVGGLKRPGRHGVMILELAGEPERGVEETLARAVAGREFLQALFRG